MKAKKQKRTGYSYPNRLSFHHDENIHPWLPMLLDAYYIVDKGVDEAIRTELKKGRRLACRKGCSHCCTIHQTIPVYPLELVGLSWYVIEKIQGPERNIIKNQLGHYRENDPCPFLVTGTCSVHQMRPASCRQFTVFGEPCREGEDPYYTRRQDVLTPIPKYIGRAFFIMLPFYGVSDETERWKIVEEGSIHQVVKLLQTCNWKSLAEKMDAFERKT